MLSYKSIIILAFVSLFSSVEADLKLGFYRKSCPKAENLIWDLVRKHIQDAPTLASPLLRMQFHDCFVRGCDGSVLLNSTSENQAEKEAAPNLRLRGFDFIDLIKSSVEAKCPGVVSCADILALVARDAVAVIGGPFWRVPTGRRDGLISKASEAASNIPGPNFNLSQLQTSFASKGLNENDLVLLSGSHTIGNAHCPTFGNRLYNFSGRGDQDPSLDAWYAEKLKKKCRSLNDSTTIVEMDPGSSKTFDLSYYKLLIKRRGLFQSDAALTTGAATMSAIVSLVNGPSEKFFVEFGLAMEKMGRIEVKTGSYGEIRKNCAVVNS